jgi:hypothetical protein
MMGGFAPATRFGCRLATDPKIVLLAQAGLCFFEGDCLSALGLLHALANCVYRLFAFAL